MQTQEAAQRHDVLRSQDQAAHRFGRPAAQRQNCSMDTLAVPSTNVLTLTNKRTKHSEAGCTRVLEAAQPMVS